jgi:tetratricopeptide (TPR) repeat protein
MIYFRKSWDFVQEFVLAGGLEPLVGLLTDTNLYERSQALETLLTVTDCDVFDWFIPPPNHTKHSSHTVQQMHHQLLNLGTIPFFLDNIVKNRTETYPGGSFRALQLLAFWLSWVRALYTKDQKLALSRKLLEDIRLWGLASEFPKEDIEEEKKLAQTLLEDFGGSASDDSNSSGLQGVSFPTISSSNTSAGGTALEQWKSIGIDQVILNDNKNPDTSTITMERILSIKEEGNKLYKKSEFDRALHYYQQALYQITQLDVQSSTDTLNDDNIELSLRSNIANTYWKLFVNNKSHSVDSSNSTSTSAEDNQAASYLAACELHCRAVLEKFPFHIKATYRLVSVLLTQKYPKLAYDLCFGVIQHLKSSGKAHKREDLELFERLKLKCTAAGIISGAVVDIAEWDVSVQHLKIFEALIKRNQLQDKVSVSKFYVDNLTNPTPSLSLGGKHISNTIQSISLNDIDEDYHGKALAAKKDSDASMLEKKVSVVEKPSDVKIKKKMKLSNEDKQHIQRLKVLSIKLSKEPTDNAVEEAKSVGFESRFID